RREQVDDGLLAVVQDDAVDAVLGREGLAPREGRKLTAARQVAAIAGFTELARQREELGSAVLELDAEAYDVGRRGDDGRDGSVGIGAVVEGFHDGRVTQLLDDRCQDADADVLLEVRTDKVNMHKILPSKEDTVNASPSGVYQRLNAASVRRAREG